MTRLNRLRAAMLLTMSLLAGCQQKAPVAAAPTVGTDTPRASVPVTELPPKIEVPIVAEPPKSPTPSKGKLKWLMAEIARKQKRSAELWAYARQFDDHTHIGTAYNELHIEEHSCYVLGHLLRRGQSVMQAEVDYDTDLSNTTVEGTQDIRIDAHSMDNFVHVAKAMLDKPADERVAEWNVDCVGEFGIARDAYIVTSGSTSFYAIKNEGTVLQILGDIEAGFTEKVRSALQENPKVTSVALGSGGGSVAEAIKTGMMIRDRKLTTVLWNSCYSACPLVFLGGQERIIYSPYPKLGFHQLYTLERGAESPNAPVYQVVRTYVQAMGADANYVLLNMWLAGPAEMNFVDPGDGSVDLCERGIATWIQRGCRSD